MHKTTCSLRQARKLAVLVQEGETNGLYGSKCNRNVIRERGVRRNKYQGPNTANWFAVVAKERVWVFNEHERTNTTKRGQLQVNGGLAYFIMNTKLSI